MNELPEGWVVRKLGEVCDRISEKHQPSQQSVFYVGLEHIEKDTGKILAKAENIEATAIKNLFQTGDILYGKLRPYLNKVAIADKGGVCSTDILVLRPKPLMVSKRFLHLLMLSHEFVNVMSANTSGVNLPRVPTNFVLEYAFTLPPLPVQHAIVTKLEEIFSELDHGVAQLKTARQQLKVYRQAVLNTTVVGDATHTIEDVIDSLDQGWSPKCENEPSSNNDEWAVIKTTAVQAGYYQDSENKKLPSSLEPRKQHELKKGDLLITRAGPRVRVGICCLVKKTRPRLLNCDKVYRMRINPNLAIPEYVEILLNSPKYSKEIEKMKTGISDSGVNLTQKGFIKILIPLPPLPEQHRIVSEIERRLSVCDKMEQTIEESLRQAEVLRAGVLKRAFEGGLVVSG